MVETGQNAPNVKLKLTNENKTNEDFNLASAYLKSTTVLYFFPAAYTGVCTKSSCELRNDIHEFAKMNAQIFGVSTDSPFTQKKFISDNELNYPLLSDWNKDAIKAFDIEDNNFAGGLVGVSKRSLFVIKDSKIAYKWIAESPGNYPPFDEMKKFL